MYFYPFNLVLAVAVASATLFLGYLPTRQLVLELFLRQPFRLGFAWLVVGCGSSPDVLHYYVLLALLCFIAWWRLRGDHGLSGKLWLCAAAGLGASLGVVLILAVTPGSWPNHSVWLQALFLVSLYLGGAVIGFAYVLYVCTRPASSRAGIEVSRQAGLLFRLILIQAGLTILGAILKGPFSGRFHPADAFFKDELFTLLCSVLVLPILGSLALRQVRSPRPSTAGLALWSIVGVGFLAAVAPLL